MCLFIGDNLGRGGARHHITIKIPNYIPDIWQHLTSLITPVIYKELAYRKPLNIVLSTLPGITSSGPEADRLLQLCYWRTSSCTESAIWYTRAHTLLLNNYTSLKHWSICGAPYLFSFPNPFLLEHFQRSLSTHKDLGHTLATCCKSPGSDCSKIFTPMFNLHQDHCHAKIKSHY